MKDNVCTREEKREKYSYDNNYQNKKNSNGIGLSRT